MISLFPGHQQIGMISLDHQRLSIRMEGDGVWHLLKQVDRDIAAKALNHNGTDRPAIPFTLFDLLAIERLVPMEIVNVVMTHAERKLLGHYVACLLKRARDADDMVRARAYDELLDELIGGTLITFQL